MKADFAEPDCLVFAVEVHSCEPKLLVGFYERILNVRFTMTTYPFLRYIANLGKIALIVSDSAGDKTPATLSDPGQVTFYMVSKSGKSETCTGNYFLHPARPIGGQIPARFATRLKDPNGNCIALATPLAWLLGSVPRLRSWGELLVGAKELWLMGFNKMRIRVRLTTDQSIDRIEYAINRPTFVRKSNLSRYSHIVSSREGLFAVSPNSYKFLLRGRFFGVTVKDGAIYCFQSCGIERQNKGRILRVTVAEDKIRRVEVLVKGLDDGCHQIDFVRGHLLVVDCHNGCLLQIDPKSWKYTTHYPLGRLNREEAMKGCHINSIAGHPDGTVWVLLHNSVKKHSEVIVLDTQFNLINRFQINAGAAHNIVFTNDEAQYLIADSGGGRVISAQKTVVEGEMMFLRGLSLDHNTCVVGASFGALRPFRRYVPGHVRFFDRKSWRCDSSIALPAAPMDIRRIDGEDLSITDYLLSQTAAGRLSAAYRANGTRETIGQTNI